MSSRMTLNNMYATILSFVNKSCQANKICTAPTDGLIVKMHYRWTFFMFIGGFCTIYYNWYYSNSVITCVSHFNSEVQIRTDYINICLTYPFLDLGNDNRRYLLFYRWIHWSLLVLAGVYYIPRKISKAIENPRAKKLFEEITMTSARSDRQEVDYFEACSKYFTNNLQTHDLLYYKVVGLNFFVIVLDLLAMQYLDFLIQGRFWSYGYMAFPFNRDPRKFTDYMSQTFPPFVSCQIAPENQLVNKRSETLGCHLTAMELYEKLFVFLWFWLIILTFISCCYLVFLLLMHLPGVKLFMLRPAKPISAEEKVRTIIEGIVRNCRIGDIYLLYRIKQHLSHVRFYELLTRLSNPDLVKPKAYLAYIDSQIKENTENIKNRRNLPNNPGNPNHATQISAEYLQMIANHNNMQNTPYLNYPAPNGQNPNTSILIDNLP